MDDEQKQLRAIAKGSKAKAALDNEAILNAFNYLESEYIKRWKSCDSQEGRDRLWQGTQVLEKVKEHLALAIRDGEVAKRILDDVVGRRAA